MMTFLYFYIISFITLTGVTTPFPCVDAVDNCDEYEPNMCTDMQYRLFAERNCLKYCNLCNGIQH